MKTLSSGVVYLQQTMDVGAACPTCGKREKLVELRRSSDDSVLIACCEACYMKQTVAAAELHVREKLRNLAKEN